jgi:CRP/FNR family transcriptional regulator, cyclic AMP receptor protein
LKSRIATAVKPALTFRPSAWLATIRAGKSHREYAQDQQIFAQGEDADAVFYVEQGKVQLSVMSSRGKEVVIGGLGQGTFFGEGCLAGQPLRMSTASTLKRSLIVRLEKKRMVSVLHREPAFAERFTAYILSRNVRIEEDLIDHLFSSSEKRLARALLLLAQFGKSSKPQAVIPKLTQDTLASMIGTTPSRVRYFMKRFRKLGFIGHEKGGLQVHNGLLNVVLRD